nr:hypothetical protein [candidate division Zixibacteria bacterium]
MKISHGFEYAAFWILARTVQLMPGWLADKVAVGLGGLAFYVLASRRRIALNNLHRAFKKEKSEDECRRIARLAFVNFARTTIEFMRLPVVARKGFRKVIPGTEGEDIMESCLKQDKGVVFITGHIGNWEYLGGWLASLGQPADLLVGQQHNPYVDKMINNLRRAAEVGIIPVGVAARHVIKALKNNHRVAFVSDHHSASGGVVVRLFDRPASTPKGAASFVVQVGSPLVLGLMIRIRYNLFRIIAMPPIYPPNSGDKEKDIKDITQQYTSLLESVIRQYPEQWMWTHRRWKLD